MAGSELQTAERLPVHLDEDGTPCTRHPVGLTTGLLHLAAVGSRSLALHHDQASRLQSMMMAVEEIADMVGASPELTEMRAAADTAVGALGQLSEMFAANRSFARTTERVRVPVTALLTRSSRRSGVMIDTSAIGEVEIAVMPAMAEHAFALLLEVLGADLAGKRVVASADVIDHDILITLDGAPPSTTHRPQVADLVTIAGYALGRDHGELRCGRPGGPGRFVVKLPI